jgi:type VI secretion system protein ImpD
MSYPAHDATPLTVTSRPSDAAPPRLPGVAAASRRRDPAAIEGLLNRLIVEIDRLLTAQVNRILHHHRFQQLEATWRSLHYLTSVAAPMSRLKIKLLDVSWSELCRDFERAIDFDQSTLFNKIYSSEFGSPGGEPFGLLIGDYYVAHRPSLDHATDDVGALKAIAGVAAAAFCPFITSCVPSLLGLDHFDDLGAGLELTAAFDGPEFLRWRRLREEEDTRFVGLALPRILIRRPYRDDPHRVDGFRFCEEVGETHARAYLWGNAAFAFGAITMRAFDRFGWFADLRGAPEGRPGGGLVDDLHIDSFATDRVGVADKPGVEVALSDRQERQLSELGFIPLSKASYLSACVFYSNQSLHWTKPYDRAVASANARLSAMIQYVLCASRFAHYLKVIGREKIGSLATAANLQRYLDNWLQDYCVGQDDVSQDVKARYPLREAAVQVRDIVGRPGSFGCVVHLRPHFQLDEIHTAFRLVTELVTVGGSSLG